MLIICVFQIRLKVVLLRLFFSFVCRLCVAILLKMENTRVDIVVNESVIQYERANESVLLVLRDPFTNLNHGYVEFFRENNGPKTRKRTKNDYANIKKRKFNCTYCDYSAKDNYMVTRHVARIHEKTVATKLCTYCDFSTIYASNLKRHIKRTHSSKLSSSSQATSSDYHKVFSD